MGPSECDPDGSGGPHTFTYTPEDADQPTMAIIGAVAWTNGVDIYELDPLHHVIDTDGLETLFGQGSKRRDAHLASNRPTPSDLRLMFQYEGCAVTVTPDKIRIEIERVENASR